MQNVEEIEVKVKSTSSSNIFEGRFCGKVVCGIVANEPLQLR